MTKIPTYACARPVDSSDPSRRSCLLGAVLGVRTTADLAVEEAMQIPKSWRASNMSTALVGTDSNNTKDESLKNEEGGRVKEGDQEDGGNMQDSGRSKPVGHQQVILPHHFINPIFLL